MKAEKLKEYMNEVVELLWEGEDSPQTGKILAILGDRVCFQYVRELDLDDVKGVNKLK